MKNPRLVFIGLEDNYTDEKLLEELIAQNHKISEQDQLKIVHSRQQKRTGKWIIYAETIGTTFNKLANTVMNVGWRSIRVKEDLSIKKCFNCQQFNHKIKDCKNKTICEHCAGEHEYKHCNQTEKIPTCTNCIYVVNKFQEAINVNHSATDITECPCYKKRIQRSREQTNYKVTNL